MNNPENKRAQANLEAPGEDIDVAISSDRAPYSDRLDDLHDLFGPPLGLESSDTEDPLAQLRDDPNYAALIRDLEYIASQARLLLEPADEAPSDEVWTKIQSQLETRPPKPFPPE